MRSTLSQTRVCCGGRPQPSWPMRVLFVVAMMWSAVVTADPIEVFFLVSKPTTDYLDVLNTVKQELGEKFPNKYKYRVEFVSEARTPDSIASQLITSADLIVTIGTAAADSAYRYKALESKALQSKALQSKAPQPKSGAPVISVLITDSSFIALAKKHFGSVDQAFASQLSSICIDQPTSRSIHLAKLLLPKATKAGVMLGHSSAMLKEKLTGSINTVGMESEFVTVGAKDNPIAKIEPLMRKIDLFIPVPDSRLMNIATAKWILHLSYRHKVPVIAFSRTYVKAGALAAIYSSPQNVAMQAVEWITDDAMTAAEIGQAHPPEYYSIHFNYSVAASLDVPIKTEQFYRQRLQGGNK